MPTLTWIFRLLFGLLIVGQCIAVEIPNHVLSSPESKLVNFDVALLIDKSNELSIENIASKAADAQAVTSYFNIATNNHHWFVFSLENASTFTLHPVIRLGEVFAETVDLYYQKNGQWHLHSAGLNIPIEKRSIPLQVPVFEVTLAPGEQQVYYLNVRTEFQNYIRIFVDNMQSFAVDNAWSSAGYFAFFGASLSLIAYNLFLYFSIRDPNYLNYVLYGLLFVSFSTVYGGFSLYLFQSPDAHYDIHATIALMFIFMAQFVRGLLETRHKSKLADRILIAVAVVFFCVAVLVIIDIRFYTVFLNLVILAAVIFWSVGILMLYKGSKTARYYLIATTLYLIAIAVSAALALGLLPYSSIYRHAYMAGSITELIIFALALGYRYRLLTEQKLETEQSLTVMVRKQRSELERQVEQRTVELREANDKLIQLSITDGLTGIANRRHFDDCLNKEWNRAKRNQQPISLIMCDLDHFKAYNDSLGHIAGDKCIHTVARAISSTCKRSSDVASRYGGEEFAIILPNTNLAAALEMCQAIQQRIAELKLTHPAETENSFVTLSFGVSAMLPDDSNHPDQLISDADEALYKSKKDGRNRITPPPFSE